MCGVQRRLYSKGMDPPVKPEDDEEEVEVG